VLLYSDAVHTAADHNATGSHTGTVYRSNAFDWACAGGFSRVAFVSHTWKIFSFELDNSLYASVEQNRMTEILNDLEETGWEPRQINFWSKTSAGDGCGVTIYARSKDNNANPDCG